MKYLIVKDNQYLSANDKFTNNQNFAYVYDDKKQAEMIAQSHNAKVIEA